MKIAVIRFLLIALCAVQAGPVLAAPRDEALAGISRCAGLPDDRALLDCIYGAAQPLRAELGLLPATPAQIHMVPPELTPPVPQNTAAMARASGALHMASYGFATNGFFTVALSNGEVWRQSPNDIKLARWRDPAANYAVSVTQNMLGGYMLHVQGDPKTYLIQRMR